MRSHLSGEIRVIVMIMVLLGCQIAERVGGRGRERYQIHKAEILISPFKKITDNAIFCGFLAVCALSISGALLMQTPPVLESGDIVYKPPSYSITSSVNHAPWAPANISLSRPGSFYQWLPCVPFAFPFFHRCLMLVLCQALRWGELHSAS